jgi:hypothetical protein
MQFALNADSWAYSAGGITSISVYALALTWTGRPWERSTAREDRKVAVGTNGKGCDFANGGTGTHDANLLRACATSNGRGVPTSPFSGSGASSVGGRSSCAASF